MTSNRKLKLWELERVDKETFLKQKKEELIIILDNIRSLNNVGSFFRTCDAFNVKKIYLCGITPQPPHREINKTAIGATQTVNWEYRESALTLTKELKAKGNSIISIEQASKTKNIQELSNFINKPLVLVFGNEVQGVDQSIVDLSHEVMEIPQYGTKHSLNVSVCAGIAIWEATKNRSK